MAPGQKQTYFVYNEGFDERLLRLGSLVLDYANPRLRKPYVHAEQVDTSWFTADQRRECYLACQNDSSWDFGVGLQELLSFNYSRTNEACRVVAGPEGSVTELIDPHKFFKEVVLTSDNARLWLEIRLSVADKMQRLFKTFKRRPKIWLLTGIYEIEDATTCVVTRKSSKSGVNATVPIPEPTGLATLLLQPGAKVELGSGTTISSRVQIMGMKVWAAQWQQVEAKFLLAEDWKDKGEIANRLKLLDLVSLQVERGTADTKYAEVDLNDEDVASVQGDGELLDEDYWAMFDREVERTEEDFEE